MTLGTRRLGTVLSLSLFVAGCGGGSSQYSGSSSQQVPLASLSGSVMKGVMQHARVVAQPVVEGKADTSRQYETYTDATGTYSLSVPASAEQWLISVMPAADGQTLMTCDAPAGCGQYGSYPNRAAANLDINEPWGSIDFGDKFILPANSTFLLTSVSPQISLAGNNQVNVTPITHLVASWVQHMG
ncbi:MAG TPA: hypothetical protein VFM46_19650, partial [Pseudomonadales bacterium]|nr:hypothetical protein [Pseudomonadales bacterium]